MRRPHIIVIALVVCVCGGRASAQTAPVAEGWVVLPVDEYRALRERAFPAPAAAAAPPVEAALTRIDYDLRIDGDAIAGRALLTMDVLREGWTRVQLPAGLIVREASVDGRRVAIVDGASPHLLLSRAGRSVLALDVVVPLASSAGAESIVLPPSPSPISRARLTLPRGGVDLLPTGGFVADRSETPNESRWTIFGKPGVPLTLMWKRKIDDRRAELPLRIRAHVTELVGLGEDACQVTAAVRVEVLQGLAREITVLVPAGLVVNQVNGSTVADWESANGTLRVALLEPAAAEASFIVVGDARTAREGAIAVPLLRMPGAERESGGVAVDIAGAGEVAAQQTRGFDRADPSQLGELVASRESPSMIAFRRRPLAGGDPRSLTVDVVRYTPQAVVVANVEEARYRALASEDGRLLVEGRYAIRNNQRSFLKAALPAGASLWSVEVAGRPIQPGLAGDGALLLPLEKGRAGEEAPTFVVEIVYLQRIEAWVDRGKARVELPALDLPVSRTGVQLRYSPRFRIEPQAGAFRVEDDHGPTAEALRRPRLELSVSAGRGVGVGAGIGSATGGSIQGFAGTTQKSQDNLKQLADRFRNEAGGRSVAGPLPVHVDFPDFGPWIFLATELTAETRAPSVDLLVRRASN